VTTTIQPRDRFSIQAVLAFALALFTPFLAPTLAQAAAGDLDSSFGAGGKVTTDLGGTDDESVSIAIDSQGRIIAAGVGGATYDFTLARYNPNGSLDRSFGSDGRVATDFGGGPGFASATSVAIDPQGRIVSAGYTQSGSGDADFAVARYNPNGSLDPSFGTGGKVTTDFGAIEFARSMAIDSQGRIVVLGQRGLHRGWFVLARYSPDGTLDSAFSADGKAITGFRGLAVGARASSVAIDSGDRIVAAGYIRDSSGDHDFALVRYSRNGIVSVHSFGSGGKVTTDFGEDDNASSMMIDSRGRIVAAGDTDSNSDFALARYSSDGSLDRSFGGDGRVTTDFAGSADDVAIDSQGRIVATGYSGNGDSDRSAFALARYNPNGSLDGSFGPGGKVTTDFGTDTLDEALSVAIDSQERIVAAGARCSVSGCDFALARYLG
jgi:uncharacterized delta-60 repeat protein